MNSFQAIVLFLFGALAVVGVGIFAATKAGSKANFKGNVMLWGTISEEAILPVVSDVSTANSNEFSLSYRQMRKEDFSEQLLEAIANGTAPDVVILPEELLYKHRRQFIIFPKETLSERTFKDTFVERGEVFFGQNGAYALPIFVDPLVLFWNRDMLSASGISRVPRTWEEVVANTPALTKKDERGNILQSAIAMGGINNILNMKAIVSALLLQVGDKITEYGEDDAVFSLLGETNPASEPSLSALRFFIEFGNPTKSVYTWNTALPQSAEMFKRGELAMYLGFASELPLIRSGNPNLNLDVSMIPQREGSSPATYGKSYGLAILRNAKSPQASYSAAYELLSRDNALLLMSASGVPSASRSTLSERFDDPFMTTFAKSALVAKGWIDPDPTRTSAIFKRMMDRIMTGSLGNAESLRQAREELKVLVQ
ncbi:MAG: hypothetical protein COV07_01230 [Candidatus Vogelbacteria bacterium CG10_big_fil_rev_8_21_14_0_10_45_14]|uniref:ABC transporter substrate-binding protein n=1 Tax=Candidatus Vogelbacteria bacterium CG10_big_fil_rev_8_21_14_0_10_45_14 TaxID=1975042 RepID=A0A2H0RKI2_9BACT|nr:MAG: hypothetical protein COV07_01230 [Candidatus Vogelbacteria bacterium CG10_big_fil_rev_8_21_14_0_10_45_14]